MKPRQQNKGSGFTLIELLIVIALLGILALGLLAAIDPIEQIRRGNDTSIRNLAAQYYNLQQRYYTTHGVFTPAVAALAAPTQLTAAALSGETAAGGVAVTSGEAKANFQDQITQLVSGTARGASVYVSTANTGTTLIVCFRPTSKSFTTDPADNCTSAGACSGAPNTAPNNIYTCIQ